MITENVRNDFSERDRMIGRLIFLFLFFFIFPINYSIAGTEMEFELIWESPSLSDSPIHLMAAADLNGNGINEIVITDFSNFLEGQEKLGPTYNFIAIERGKISGKALFEEKWRKQWYTPFAKNVPRLSKKERRKQSRILGGVVKLVPFTIGSRVVIEGVPPYMALEWSEGNYMWHEQSGSEDTMVGSWALPFLHPSCTIPGQLIEPYPRECLLDIRDFGDKGKPIIITFYQERKSLIRKLLDRSGGIRQSLRIRRYEEGFPLEWESSVDNQLPQ